MRLPGFWNAGGWVRVSVSTVLVLGLLAATASDAGSEPDYLNLGDTPAAVIDVLINDSFADGAEAVVSFPQLPSSGGLTVTQLAENGLVKVSVTQGSSGRATFSYLINGTGAAIPVEVCGGKTSCEWLQTTPAASFQCLAPGLCVRPVGASDVVAAGGTIALGHGVSGSYRDVQLELKNATSTTATGFLQAAAGTRYLHLLDSSARIEQWAFSVTPGATATATLRVYFLPSTDAAPTVDTLNATITAGTATSTTFRISRVGDGAIAVPGFASCAFGDTCIFLGATKLVSVMGGSRIGGYFVCGDAPPFVRFPVKVGFPKEVPLTLVHNGIAGLDPVVTAALAADLPVTIRYAGAIASSVPVPPGEPTLINAMISPLTTDVSATPQAADPGQTGMACPSRGLGRRPALVSD